jgi:hypothetical protein
MIELLDSVAVRTGVILLVVIVLLAGILATLKRVRRRREDVVEGRSRAGPTTEQHPTPHEPIAFLEFDQPPGRVPVYRSRLVIGRHRDDDVQVNDIRVSRHHALVLHDDAGGFEIHNQTAGRSEPNDLLVNGVYKEHAKLSDGDRVTIGGVSFTFRHPGTSATRVHRNTEAMPS